MTIKKSVMAMVRSKPFFFFGRGGDRINEDYKCKDQKKNKQAWEEIDAMVRPPADSAFFSCNKFKEKT